MSASLGDFYDLESPGSQMQTDQVDSLIDKEVRTCLRN